MRRSSVMGRAFTLIELLSVMAIIAVLASILFPVLSKAMMSAKITSAGSRLRQYHLLTVLYRNDQDASSESGSPVEMGLPWDLEEGGTSHGRKSPIYDLLDVVERDPFKRSPCGYIKHEFDVNAIYYMPLVVPDWSRYTRLVGERTVLWVDPNCNSSSTRIDSQFATKRALGVTLGGQLLNRISSEHHYWSQSFFIDGY
jgi:prepilin-type N-terminal cleavage/methylation domain-containing protein